MRNPNPLLPPREKDLLAQIVGLLHRHGLTPLYFRTDKRNTAVVGWPDITFAVPGTGQGVVWELKVGDGRHSIEQVQIMQKLMSDSWRYATIRSYDDALRELREMGIE